MQFKPRYSLLTLLALTAIVAVGVKLWYGPHHVVERPSSNLEDEYTYTRDWTGSKIVQGPRVLRYHRSDETLEKIVVVYFRNGLNTRYERDLHAAAMGASGFQLWDPETELTPTEKVEFQQVITTERERIQKLGLIPWEPEYLDWAELRK